MKNLTVLIVGDLMIDEWRISTELEESHEHTKIFKNPKVEYTLGGAGNVARHFRNLDVVPIVVHATMSGADYQKYKSAFDECKLGSNCHGYSNDDVTVGREPKTTIKRRWYRNGQQMFREDEEEFTPINEDTIKRIASFICHQSEIDAIVISDYNKGFCNPMLNCSIIFHARQYCIPVFVDPKFDNIESFRGADWIKFNRHEAWRAALELDIHSNRLEDIVRQLQLRLGGVIMTHEQHPTLCFANTGEVVSKEPPYVAGGDSCGAGDAFLAAFVTAIIDGIDVVSAVMIANKYAAESVKLPRTGLPDFSILKLDEQIDSAKEHIVERFDSI